MNIFLQLQVAETVPRSSRNGHYVPHIVNDAKDPVLFYEWKSYLQELVKPLIHIIDYHHLFIDSKHSGVVKCKESVSYEQFTFNLLKFKTRLPQPQTLPNVPIIKCFDPARQWYVYDHIRQRCYSEEAKELTCPKPTVPKKEIYLTNHEIENEYRPKGEGKRPF
jgi:hypothetical protein